MIDGDRLRQILARCGWATLGAVFVNTVQSTRKPHQLDLRLCRNK